MSDNPPVDETLVLKQEYQKTLSYAKNMKNIIPKPGFYAQVTALKCYTLLNGMCRTAFLFCKIPIVMVGTAGAGAAWVQWKSWDTAQKNRIDKEQDEVKKKELQDQNNIYRAEKLKQLKEANRIRQETLEAMKESNRIQLENQKSWISAFWPWAKK